MVAGESLTLTATVTNATDTSVTWKVDDATVASVKDGVVTGIKAGTVVVSATSVEDSTKTATISITVTTPTLDFANLIKATDNYTLKATQGENSVEMHVTTEGFFISLGFGVIIKDTKGYMFSQYADGKYYYSDKDVATKEDGTEETVDGIKERISWSGLYSGVGAFAFTEIKDGGAVFTATLPATTNLGSLINSCFPMTAEGDATTPAMVDTKLVVALNADKTLKTLTITGLKADVAVTIDAIGTTELGVTPIWTLNEGIEAGDGTGEGWND